MWWVFLLSLDESAAAGWMNSSCLLVRSLFQTSSFLLFLLFCFVFCDHRFYFELWIRVSSLLFINYSSLFDQSLKTILTIFNFSVVYKVYQSYFCAFCSDSGRESESVRVSCGAFLCFLNFWKYRKMEHDILFLLQKIGKKMSTIILVKWN